MSVRRTVVMGWGFAGWLSIPALLLAQAVTEPETAEEVEEPLPPRYYVEVLVFAHEGDGASSSEHFGPPPILAGALPESETTQPLPPVEEPVAVYSDRPLAPPAPLADELAPEEGASEGDLDEEEEIPVFELLEAEALALVDSWDKLEELSAYNTLLYGAWAQQGYGEEFAEPFDVATIDDATPISGTLTLHKSRFLHMHVDLEYVPTQLAQPAEAGDAFWVGVQVVEPMDPRYHLDETRRLRSGELHYFDHPAFGVLIRVIPEPEPEAEFDLDLESLPEVESSPATVPNAPPSPS